MLLDKIIDIDPEDQTISDLADLANKFGIFNMTAVLIKVKEFQALNGQRVKISFDEETYRQVVATFLSLAILNIASFKHENFSILINQEMAQNFTRIYSADDHQEFAEKYISQALFIINEYE